MKMKIKPRIVYLFNLLILVVHGGSAGAAACCGGGYAFPSLIAGDEKAQLTTSVGYGEVIADVGSDALWRKRSSTESSETLKIDAAHVFADRWQGGLSLPVVRRALAERESTGIGDVAGTVGYEYLPDWDYNPWRPKGIGFLQIVAPTGRSPLEAEMLDARGRGFWGVGVGSVFLKSFSRWDVYSSFTLRRLFARQYSTNQFQGTITPGFGGDLNLGCGYNFSNLRLGGSIGWTYEDPVTSEGSYTSQSSAQRYATALVSIGYLIERDLSVSIQYADQTLFGSPVNVALNREVTALLQKRWSR